MKYSDATFGLAEAVFNKLGGLEGVQRFLRGDSEVLIKTHIINCDAQPFVLESWSIEEHLKGGQLQFDASQVSLYLCDEQRGGSIEGNKLRKKLKGESVANACVLDYLLANPQLIPEDWKGKYVFFWGTLYLDSNGNLYVRYLNWNGKQWNWNYNWLDNDFNDNNPAALLRNHLHFSSKF